MSKAGETFFTSVGCMDGRSEWTVAKWGRDKFSVLYADTITEAGLVGLLARLDSARQAKKSASKALLSSLKKKILISLEKHRSKGIIVHGHQECAGNPVDDEKHKEDVRKSVKVIKSLINSSVPVVGVFVKRSFGESSKWEVEEV